MTVKCYVRWRWLLHGWQPQRQLCRPHPPLTDYSVAVARAIAWLGDRYLLARLVKAARYQPVPYWLYRTGQSLWLDNITRELLTKGTLARYVSELSIDGLTSNRTDLRRPPSMRSPLGCLGQ